VPSITVTDREALTNLGNQFAFGRDYEPLPVYRHPGLTYTRFEFEGPYTPAFLFTSHWAIMVHGQSGSFAVRTRFARAVADVLGLKPKKPASADL